MYKANLGGIILESEVFKMLQEKFENSRVQDTVVITGWKDNTPNAKKEFDFLIISLTLKAIIHIEVKRTLSKKAKEAATRQLDDGHNIINNKVPFAETSNWKYIQYISYCYKDENDQEISQFLESQSHFQSQGAQINDWLEDLSRQMPENYTAHDSPSCREDPTTYLRILKYFLHQMFIQEDVLTQGEWVCAVKSIDIVFH